MHYILPITRPIRIEFSGALYHVTSRGDRRENIYEDDEDRIQFLDVLRRVVEDFKAVRRNNQRALRRMTEVNIRRNAAIAYCALRGLEPWAAKPKG